MTTFTMRDKKQQPFGEPVPYTPVLFTCGTTTHRLALHRVPGALTARHRNWAVSHPVIGARVCEVISALHGMPVSSRHLTTKQARAAALAQLERLCERIGSDKFNATIAQVQP